MKTLKELNERLDAFNATLNDENEDTPELLAEQERLLNAVMVAEAADLGALSAKELIAHFAKRAPGETLAKGLSKAALIARISALPPFEPTPTPTAEEATSPAGWRAPEPQPSIEDEAAYRAQQEPETFSVAAYASAHGLDAPELRKKLRADGLRAPYTLEQVEKAVKS